MKNPLNAFAGARTIQRRILSKQDELVREARALANADTSRHDAHLERLRSLGFTNVEEVRRESNALTRKNLVRQTLEQQEEYALKYPGFRFVATAVMEEVCAQYGLVIGAVDRYLGQVPEWAAKVISESGVMGDLVWRVWYRSSLLHQYESQEEIPARYLKDPDLTIRGEHRHALLIAAPRRNMLVRANEEVRNHRIVRKDPIVMIAVPGGYIVLAAWDEEGRDPRILNPANN